MDQMLLIAGSSVYVALGLGHVVLTLLDLRSPRYFTPTDDEIRQSMQGVSIRLNRHVDLWKAWLGFNLSHSLGLVLFGAVVLTFAVKAQDAYFSSIAMQATTLVISLIYVMLSFKFWFWAPAIGCITATALFGAACFL